MSATPRWWNRLAAWICEALHDLAAPPWKADVDDDEDWDDENGGDCFWCGGDGYVEGDDPGWDLGEWVRCSSCNGSGRAKDMTIW